MPNYYEATNYGKGFIQHPDNEQDHISGYPGNVWVTENASWALRVGAQEKSKAEAQALVDAAISGSVDSDGNQIVINLP